MDWNSSANANRRNVLKMMGTGGAALTGLPTVVSAKKVSDNEVKHLKNEPPVEAIRDAVGGFEVKSAEKKQVEGVNTVTGTEMSTDIGELLYLEPEGEKPLAQLELDDLEEKPYLRKQLPVEYRTVPKETEIVLKADPEIGLVRTATHKEKEKMAKLIEGKVDEMSAIYDRKGGKYHVTIGDSDREHENPTQYLVDAKSQGESVPTGEPKQINKSNSVTVQSGCASSQCVSCVGWGATRIGCYVSCGMGNVVSCLYCLGVSTGTAFGAFPACDTCADQCL